MFNIPYASISSGCQQVRVYMVESATKLNCLTTYCLGHVTAPIMHLVSVVRGKQQHLVHCLVSVGVRYSEGEKKRVIATKCWITGFKSFQDPQKY